MAVGLCFCIKALKENVFPADQSCWQHLVALGWDEVSVFLLALRGAVPSFPGLPTSLDSWPSPFVLKASSCETNYSHVTTFTHLLLSSSTFKNSCD